MVAAIGFILSLSAFTTFITTGASGQARFGIFVPLLVMSIGWVQSRKKFCLAYGFTGTFNFGKMGEISRVADPADRAADRRTALIIFAQSALYAAVLTLLVVALPL
jgi:hypothetical protein